MKGKLGRREFLKTIAAMKVIGGGILGAWSGYVVPGFNRKRLKQLPGAAIRYVLDDGRFHLLVIGMRLLEEVDANINTLSRDVILFSIFNSALFRLSVVGYRLSV